MESDRWSPFTADQSILVRWSGAFVTQPLLCAYPAVRNEMALRRPVVGRWWVRDIF